MERSLEQWKALQERRTMEAFLSSDAVAAAEVPQTDDLSIDRKRKTMYCC